MKKSLVLFALIALGSLSAFAQTTEEARMARLTAFVDSAVAYYKANAVDAASEAAVLAQFSDPKGPWVKGELYLYVYETSGVCVAHGAKKSLIGHSLMALRDNRGHYLIRDIVSGVSKTGATSSHFADALRFNFTNPSHGNAIEPKVSYNVRTSSAGMRPLIIGSGFYESPSGT